MSKVKVVLVKKKNTEVIFVTTQISPIFNLCAVRYDILLAQYVALNSCLCLNVYDGDN
jgi:hypothetical protein